MNTSVKWVIWIEMSLPVDEQWEIWLWYTEWFGYWCNCYLRGSYSVYLLARYF